VTSTISSTIPHGEKKRERGQKKGHRKGKALTAISLTREGGGGKKRKTIGARLPTSQGGEREEKEERRSNLGKKNHLHNCLCTRKGWRKSIFQFAKKGTRGGVRGGK